MAEPSGAVGVCIRGYLHLGVAFERRIQSNSVENAERLRTTLQSIGDAVIVTDVDGRITMMNAVAKRLTGWAAAKAVGTQLFNVFHVIDETEQTETQQESWSSSICDSPARTECPCRPRRPGTSHSSKMWL